MRKVIMMFALAMGIVTANAQENVTVEATGGKVIHIDKNAGDMEEVHKIVCEHIEKYPIEYGT